MKNFKFISKIHLKLLVNFSIGKRSRSTSPPKSISNVAKNTVHDQYSLRMRPNSLLAKMIVPGSITP